MYRKRKMTSPQQVDVEELKRQLRREVLWDLRPILEASGMQLLDIGGVLSDEERRIKLACTAVGGGPLIVSDMIDNLAQPTACSLILLVGGSFQMEVGRGLVYPRQTMLDDIQMDTSSYALVKVDMVHENWKDLKLKVPPDETTLTMQHTVTRKVQWRRTFIDIDPSATTSASTTPSQSNISPTSMSPKARLSPIRDHSRLSPILDQLHLSPIQD
jgi:hypothetical protein